jgi:hypothetical protein
LQKTGRLSGASWYEGHPRRTWEGRTYIPITCRAVPADAPQRAGFVEVSCPDGKSNCTHNRRPDLDQRFDTVDAAATDACQRAEMLYQPGGVERAMAAGLARVQSDLAKCAGLPSASEECLRRTGRSSGKNWYENFYRSRMGDGKTLIPVICREVPSDAPPASPAARVICAGQDSQCTHISGPDPARRFDTLNEAASDACRVEAAKIRKQ